MRNRSQDSRAVPLRNRLGPGAVVVAVHVAVIYAVAVSLGIVRTPVAVAPMEAVMITETEKLEQEPIKPIRPEIAQPNLTEVVVPDPVVEVPVEEPLPVETVAENAITTSPEPAASADLAVTRSPQPAYPPTSRRMGEEGVVALAVLVDERGRPVEVRVQASSGFPRLDQAAVEGLRQWRFKAAVRDGAATTAWTSVRVRFRLDA
jgi:periplasmic protein TonB